MVRKFASQPVVSAAHLRVVHGVDVRFRRLVVLVDLLRVARSIGLAACDVPLVGAAIWCANRACRSRLLVYSGAQGCRLPETRGLPVVLSSWEAPWYRDAAVEVASAMLEDVRLADGDDIVLIVVDAESAVVAEAMRAVGRRTVVLWAGRGAPPRALWSAKCPVELGPPDLFAPPELVSRFC